MTDFNSVSGEAYRLSERKLEMQFTSALAADQRALSIAGLTVAAAAILAGLAANAENAIVMLLGAACLVVSAFLAWHSARPQRFHTPGAEFADLQDDIKEKVSYETLITQIGGFNDKHTRDNDKKMRFNSNLMRAAFIMAIIGLLVAIVPQLVTLLAGE